MSSSLTTVNHIDFSPVVSIGQNIVSGAYQLGGRFVTWCQNTAGPSSITAFDKVSKLFQQLYTVIKTTPYAKNTTLLIGGYCLAKPKYNSGITKMIGLGVSIFAIVGLYKEITGS